MSTFVFKQVGDLTITEINGVELQGAIGAVEITSEPNGGYCQDW